MVPAHQGFEPRHGLARSVDAGLEDDPQLPLFERNAQVRFDPLPLARSLVHLGSEEAEAPLPGRLCGVERKVGVAHQVVGGAIVIVGGDDAHGRADRNGGSVDRVGPRKAVDDALRQRRRARPGAEVAGQNDLELVAAEPADLPRFANHVAKPQGNQPEQSVTCRVAERIVHRLEPVEVEKKDRATVLSPDRADQSIVQCAAKRLAVGEAGERILPGEPVQLDLRLPDLGQVRCEAAVAEEAPDLVMDGTAGDRPPDLVLGLRPDDEVLEGDVRQQIEAERPFRSRASVRRFGRDQVGEGTFEQVACFTPKRPRHAIADVRQRSVAAGFPEPPLLAALELLDEPFGARVRGRDSSCEECSPSSTGVRCFPICAPIALQLRRTWFKFG